MTDDITLDAPETRLERFLAATAGVEGVTLDEPETRIEKYLYKIAQGGGGSGGDSNIFIVNATFDFDENDGLSVTLDKTYAEMSAAGEAGKTLLCVAGYNDYLYDVKPIHYNAFDGVGCTVDVGIFGEGRMCEISWYQEENGDPYIEGVRDWSKGGGVRVVHDVDGTLDKTWEVIDAAVKSGLVYVGEQFGDEVVNEGIIYSAGKEYNKQGEVTGYSVSALYRSSAIPSFRDWAAETADGYPVLVE